MPCKDLGIGFSSQGKSVQKAHSTTANGHLYSGTSLCFTETDHTRKTKVKQGEQRPPSHTSDTVKKNMLNCSVLWEAPICASLTRYWFAALTDYRQTKGDWFTWKSASTKEKKKCHTFFRSISLKKKSKVWGNFSGTHIGLNSNWRSDNTI